MDEFAEEVKRIRARRDQTFLLRYGQGSYPEIWEEDRRLCQRLAEIGRIRREREERQNIRAALVEEIAVKVLGEHVLTQTRFCCPHHGCAWYCLCGESELAPTRAQAVEDHRRHVARELTINFLKRSPEMPASELLTGEPPP